MKGENGTSAMEDAVGKRKVVSLTELNVTRDIMDFMFILKSDIKPEDIKYTLEIK